MDKLAEIMAWKRREIAPLVRPVPLSELERLDAELPRRPSLEAALRRADNQLAIIAEIKRRSPSVGAIFTDASATSQALLYRDGGADAISVLTDEKYFGGTLVDLSDITDLFLRTSHMVPCLRKDFMVHPVQVLQARKAGASAILVIVRALEDDEIRALVEAAAAARLDVLFEIHEEREIARAVSHGARIIGVNNRDLTVFRTDLAHSEHLIPMLPKEVVAVSESGILTPSDAARARAAGARAVLIGEALMRARDPGAVIRAFRTG
jgi:indole-3-glycerol phosphate synthase